MKKIQLIWNLNKLKNRKVINVKLKEIIIQFKIEKKYYNNQSQ
jgi:hypothetical protein